jgi:hypothetical protein
MLNRLIPARHLLSTMPLTGETAQIMDCWNFQGVRPLERSPWPAQPST